MMAALPAFHDEEVETIVGLGGIDSVVALTSQILEEYGIRRPLFSPHEVVELRRRENLAQRGLCFHFDSDKSIAANLEDLFQQAKDIQRNSGGANYVGAMMQHLVGAKLDIVLGAGLIQHHGFSVADAQTSRQGDFEVNGVAVHITTHPAEALIHKAADNISQGLRPLIITLADGVTGAAYLLKTTQWKDRVDVLDIAQFLTANVYERSLFHTNDCKATLKAILERYNEIVAVCETDPVLKIHLD